MISRLGSLGFTLFARPAPEPPLRLRLRLGCCNEKLGTCSIYLNRFIYFALITRLIEEDKLFFVLCLTSSRGCLFFSFTDK